MLDALTVPPIFDDDVEMLTSAISAAAGCPRMVFARSTAELADLYVSDGLLPDVRKRSDITIESELMPLPVDSTGHLALWS